MDFDPDDHSEIIYGPEAAKKEALRRNTGATYLVAETYAIAGLAILIQTYKLPNPPRPQPEFKPSSEKFSISALKDAPANWVGPQDVNGPNSLPDMLLWQLSMQVPLNMTNYAPIPGVGDSVDSSPPPLSSSTTSASSVTKPEPYNYNVNSCTVGSPVCCTNGTCSIPIVTVE